MKNVKTKLSCKTREIEINLTLVNIIKQEKDIKRM